MRCVHCRGLLDLTLNRVWACDAVLTCPANRYFVGTRELCGAHEADLSEPAKLERWLNA